MDGVTDVPADMVANAEGRLYPRAALKPEVLLEHDTVVDLVARAEAMHAAIKAFKQAALDDIGAFIELMAERYKVKLGGRRGGLALHAFGQLMRVEVSVADTMTFGPELEAAKALIDECLNDWTSDANANLRAVVMDAFDVGEGRKLQVDRVLGLRRLAIDDDRWQRAMQAINDALRVAQSRQYIRVYRRPNINARFEQIVLDVSRV